MARETMSPGREDVVRLSQMTVTLPSDFPIPCAADRFASPSTRTGTVVFTYSRLRS